MDVKIAISNWVDAHRIAIIEDISTLVAVKSVRGEPQPGKPFGEGPAAALDAGLALCDRLGFLTRNYDYYVGTADFVAFPFTYI